MARILVCDDSAFMRMMLKRILIPAGHEIVAEAANGLEAVAKYREFKPDLVTMDITMPEMDGIAAVRAIREEDCLARIVMVSAIGQRQFVTEAINAGASDFIVKPFEELRVITLIERLLGE